MDKEAIRAELDARGITYNARLGAEKLQAILDEAIANEGSTGSSGETGEGATGETGATGPTAPEQEEGSTGSTAPAQDEPEVDTERIRVLDRHNMTARVFTLEEHGENFVELAKEFAAKRGLRIATMNKR